MNNEQGVYEEPLMNVVAMDERDVVRTSGDGDNDTTIKQLLQD